MATVPAFYSIKEVWKLADKRVYHNDNACIQSREIPTNERRHGEGGYRLCEDCQKHKKSST